MNKLFEKQCLYSIALWDWGLDLDYLNCPNL